MLVIGPYEKNVLIRITDDTTGAITAQLLLSPDAAIAAANKIMESVEQHNPEPTKPGNTAKPGKQTTKKK